MAILLTSNILRLLCVRHAFGFLKAGLRFHHVLISVLFGAFIIKRNIQWTYHILNGTNLQRMQKGIFCMAKNLTEVEENMKAHERKEFFNATTYKGKVLAFMSTFLFNFALFFFYFAAKKAGQVSVILLSFNISISIIF